MTWLKAKLLLLSVALIWAFFICISLPVQLPITLASFLISNERLKRYVWGFWIFQDQAVNAILGGNPDVTISSKVGYMAEQVSKTAKAMAVVIDLLFKVSAADNNYFIDFRINYG